MRSLKSWSKLLLSCLALGYLLLAGPVHAETIYYINGVKTDTASYQADDDVKKIEPYLERYQRYTDYASGYSILVPAQLTPDISLAAERTVFSDPKMRVEVYYDNFAGTITNARDYVYYGNRFVHGSPDHTILDETWFTVAGMDAHLLSWQRRPLARVAEDKNNYVCAEIIKNDNEVYTVFIKSTEPITDAMEIIGSLRLEEKRGQSRNYRHFAPSATPMNAETKAFFQKNFGPAAKLKWGIFEPAAPQSMHALDQLEERLGFKFPFLLHYQMFDEYFPLMGLENAYDSNRSVELTLQTVHSGEVNALLIGRNRNASMVYDILDGKYDDYFEDYARHLKDFGHPVLFRLNNEMNGDWCYYSAFYTGKDAEMYKAMWRYIHDIFVRNGVDNVVWVWNPHDVSLPPFKWNHYLMYYPGDEYVDVVGITGYNTGTYFPGERWREFAEIYPPLYDEYAALFDKPFMITEFASSSVGGDKAAWISRMFDRIKAFDRIKVAIWWSGIDWDQNGQPGRIYILDENDATVDVFRQRLQEFR